MENVLENNDSNKQLKKIVLGATAGVGALVGVSAMSSAHADSIYTVKAGDTLSKIAQTNNVSLSTLEAANKSAVANPNLIFTNQKITVPDNSAKPAQAENHQVMYTVKAGDTLSAIAQAYHTSVQQIKDDNHLVSDTIYPGQQLVIGVTSEAAPQTKAVVHLPETEHDVSAAPKTVDATYTVKAGDSVYSVAQKHNMNVDELRDKNSMNKGDMLKPNSTIKVSVPVTQKAESSSAVQAQASSKQPVASFSSVTQKALDQASEKSTINAQSVSVAKDTDSISVKDNVEPQQNVAHAATTPTVKSSSASSVQASSPVADKVSESSSSAVQAQAKVSSVNSEVSSQASSQTADSIQATETATAQSSSAATNSESNDATSTETAQNQSSASVQASSQQAQPQQQNQNAQPAASQANTQAQNNQGSQQGNTGTQIVSYAEKYIGTPYVWGGTTPAGFDCSGFTQYVYNHNGYNIGRTTYDQCKEGPHVDANQAQAGDLLFWGSDSAPYHVGISMGGNKYIAAPEPGENVKVGNTQYYQPSYAIHYNQVN